MKKANIKTFKIFKTILLLGIIFLPSFAFAALENVYPPLPISPTITLNITETSGVADYISYFFALGIFIGILAAVVVAIFAGVRMIFAQGNPSEFNKAKSEITRALIGLVILFGAYFILNVVNSNIEKTEINSLDCSKVSICVEKTITRNGVTKVEYSGSFNDIGNLGLIDNDTMVVKKCNGIKEVWGFSEADYKGTATKLYSDQDLNNLDSDLLPGGITIGSSVKSIKVYRKIPGIYLYDAANFEVSSLPPLFLSSSAADLGEYKNKIKSIQILNQPNSKYYAVIFGLDKFNNSYDYAFYPNGTASCSDVVQVDQSSFAGTNSGSVLIFQSSDSFLAGVGDSGITAYNIINCYIPISNIGNPASVGCPIATMPFSTGDLSSCGATFGDVLSVKLAKQSGALMFSDNQRTYCTFFDINDVTRVSGDCASSDLFLNRGLAKKFIVIPYEKKL